MIKGTGFRGEFKKNRVLFFMLLPTVIYFFIFSYLPMTGLYLAFTRFNYDGGIFRSPFIGLENFRFLVMSGDLYNITKNTILYNLAFLVVGNVLQISTAIVLSELSGKYFKKITQSIMFLPYFISFVLLGAFVYGIFNFEFGLFNTILKSFQYKPVDVYADTSAWKFILVAFNAWKGLGYGTVIYLAAIMGISDDYYEAAKIDGANIFQQIRSITLPLLKPTFIILLMFSLGYILKGQFDLFYQIVGNTGNLFQATDIIDTYVFRSLIKSFDFGMGTAAGLYQSLFGFILIMVVNTLIRKVNEDYALF